MTVPSIVFRLEPLGGVKEPARLRAVKEAAAAHSQLDSTVDLETGPAVASTTLARWSAATAAAHDACVVLDLAGVVVSISAAAADLLGCSDGGVIGRPLLDVISIIDLETGVANPEYASAIPPLAVLTEAGLRRSLLRVRHRDDAVVTVDTSSSPVHDATGTTVGSITFMTRIAAP